MENESNDTMSAEKISNLIGEEINDGGYENVVKNLAMSMGTILESNFQATLDNSTVLSGTVDNVQQLARAHVSLEERFNALAQSLGQGIAKNGQEQSQPQPAMGAIQPTQGQGGQPMDPMEAIRVLAQGQLAQQQGQGSGGR